MFKIFKEKVAMQFERMKEMHLFETTVSKDKMWEIYLSSFPAGSNPMFKERTEHDCQSCKQFIRNAGNIIAIDDALNLHTIWDISIDGPYHTVADEMANYVASSNITNVLFRTEKKMGVDHTLSIDDDHNVTTWEHFFFELPTRCIRSKDDIGEHRSMLRSAFDVFSRGLKEITINSLDTVTDLINQNALYRGEENKHIITEFYSIKRYYDSLQTEEERVLYTWNTLMSAGSATVRIRNSAIGQLLQDISAEMDINEAVSRFEHMVAPANYKRTTALITKAMISKAEDTIKELGYIASLDRRFAESRDISVNDVLFANRRSKKEKNAFGELIDSIPEKVGKNLDKVQTMPIDKFIKNVLPSATSLELLLENRHQANLMSVIAPFDQNAPSMFKWDNGFSWAYKGDVTDSIKQRVKAAGGDVTGFLRCSLAWHNKDDLDIHLHCPGGQRIMFSDKHPAGINGKLDVDMNAGLPLTTSPVENITFQNEEDVREGCYRLIVHNFTKRSSENVGFEMEVAFGDSVQNLTYPHAVKDHEYVEVMEFRYSKLNGFSVISSIDSKPVSTKVWGLDTLQYHNVTLLMNSPNHWETSVGNKHYFFILQDCKNDEPARGFFNEFLSPELTKHRKVLEVLGSKMKAQPTDHQLSGLGFSSTIDNSVICRVTGNINQTIKITF